MAHTLSDKPLFVFGTLLDSDIRREVFGPEFEAITVKKAWAKGYIAKEFPTDCYPLLATLGNHSAEGLLLEELSELAFERLAFYEGDLYQLQTIKAETEEKQTIEAIYHATDAIDSTDLKDWTLTEWKKNYKPNYLKKCRQFMGYFGRIKAEEADELWKRLA